MAAMFSLLRTDEQTFDRNAAARALAPCLNKSPVDLMWRCDAWPGILAEGLDEATANSCTKALQDVGLNVKTVPTEAVVRLPQPLVLRSCEFSEEGMSYSHQQSKQTLPWPEVRWVDMADVRFEEVSQFAADPPLLLPTLLVILMTLRNCSYPDDVLKSNGIPESTLLAGNTWRTCSD
jgi:hypothetical protein